jgi:hypothetical protein
MRTHTTIRLHAAALLAACALLATACGGNEAADGATSGADRESKAREAALKYAQCMREHGVDMPDPQFSDGGGVLQRGPDGDTPREKARDAEQACRKHMEEAEPPKLSEEQQEEFKQAALAHARCMREHGIENFPDPTFGGDGRVTQRLEKGSGIDPEDASFKKAEEACQDTMPKPPSEESAP